MLRSRSLLASGPRAWSLSNGSDFDFYSTSLLFRTGSFLHVRCCNYSLSPPPPPRLVTPTPHPLNDASRPCAPRFTRHNSAAPSFQLYYPHLDCKRYLGTKAQGRKGGKKHGNKGSKKKSGKSSSPRQPPPGKTQAEKKIPPAYLHPTASPHVYIASCAAVEMEIDPRHLYDNAGIPASFRSSSFEYVSPKALGHSLPTFQIPEVTFLGKSNVGKSSLINALTRRKDLARISKSPGRTQQVNYFALVKRNKIVPQGGGKAAFRPSDATGYLVDLPGYGYAAAPDDKVSEWQANTQSFLVERRDESALRRIYLLIDARHGVSQFDRTVMGWFDEASVSYSVVLTKADRVGRAQIVRYANDICMRYHSQLYGAAGDGYQGPVVHVTSSKTGEGIEELMWSVDADFNATAVDVEGMGGIDVTSSMVEGDDDAEEEDLYLVDDGFVGVDGMPLEEDVEDILAVQQEHGDARKGAK